MTRGGQDLRHELRRARSLGCCLRRGKGSELKVSHPLMDAPTGCDSHRRDSSRLLTKWLNRLEEKSCATS